MITSEVGQPNRSIDSSARKQPTDEFGHGFRPDGFGAIARHRRELGCDWGNLTVVDSVTAGEEKWVIYRGKD
jgi:hypothetical protein